LAPGGVQADAGRAAPPLVVKSNDATRWIIGKKEAFFFEKNNQKTFDYLGVR
jgi:hypothetical protein